MWRYFLIHLPVIFDFAESSGPLSSSQGSQNLTEMKQEGSAGSNEDSQQSQDGNTLSLLPPKQRELYMRIQAQNKKNPQDQPEDNLNNPPRKFMVLICHCTL